MYVFNDNPIAVEKKAMGETTRSVHHEVVSRPLVKTIDVKKKLMLFG